MTPKEAYDKIKLLFAEPAEVNEPSVEPTEAPKEYTLKDGSKIMIDVYEVGGMVAMMDASGNPVPAPEGEYILADDTVIAVDNQSKIVSITIPSQVSENPVAANEDMEKMKQHLMDLRNEINSLKQIIANNQSNFENQNKKITGLKDVLIGLVNLPSADPIEKKSNFNNHFETREEKVAKYLEFVKSIK